MKLKRILLALGMAAVCMFNTACGSSPSGNVVNEITFADGDKIAEIEIEGYGTIKAKLFPDIAPMGVENFIKLAESGYYDGLKIHRVAKDMCIQGGSLNGDGTGGYAVLDKKTSFEIETSPDARNFYGALGYANINGQNTSQFYIVNCKKQVDITQYDPAKIREEAQNFTDKIAALEENDPALESLTAQETHFKNLADMIEKASEEAVEKYSTVGGYPMWDGGYTIFGQVFEGFDVLDKISAVEVTASGTGKVDRPKADIIISSVKIIEYKTPEPEPESSSKKKK